MLIVNRFGRRETENGGLRDEIASAVVARIPVVIGVGDGYAADWERFLGGSGTVLCEIDALEAWCLAQARIVTRGMPEQEVYA